MVLQALREESEVSLTNSDPFVVRQWLDKYHRKQLSLLDDFLLALRLGRIGVRLRTDPTAEDHHPDNNNLGEKPQQQQQQSLTSSPSEVDRQLVALQTVELLKHLVGPTSWKSAAELLYFVRAVGSELHAAASNNEPAIDNVVRRILAVIREEALRNDTTETLDSTRKKNLPESHRPSLDNILWALPQHVKLTSSSSSRTNVTASQRDHHHPADPITTDGEFPSIFYKQRGSELKQTVMEAIQEISNDLEDTYKNINEQVTTHILPGDVVLTCGRSKTTELFLKAAAAAHKKQRRQPTTTTTTASSFQVMICQGSCGDAEAKDMAWNLAQVGIPTILIPDSAIFAVMSRVDKVIVPAHAVLANGGLIARSGSNVIALAANYHAVPVVCVTGIFKLCPMFPHLGQDTLNELVGPGEILQYSEFNDPLLSDVELVNPVRDYIKPEYINLYVTNVGSFQPSFIYRLLAEYYHNDDWDIFD